MIRNINLNDIPILINFRIKLLKNLNSSPDNYNWDNYSKALKNFYMNNIKSKNLIGCIYEENNIAKGFCLMYLYNTIPLLNNLNGKMALLTDMYVEKIFRHNGIGNQLLKTIMSLTKDLGYPKVILNSSNEGFNLYKNYGFKIIEKEMVFKFK